MAVLTCAVALPSTVRASTTDDRIAALLDDVADLEDDAEDLADPVGAMALFDQCMFTIGVSQHGTRGAGPGFLFGDQHFPALSLELSGGMPAFEFLAFPQEEPPSIECNEDAQPEPVDG
ncbi:MAG: hypothetical protein J7513_15545 [Solirubrobacteraceae bacterium]|nr:hypothetical protein [Solirubrobacteraceae bacterium]